jgi:hypothetical protein
MIWLIFIGITGNVAAGSDKTNQVAGPPRRPASPEWITGEAGGPRY